MRAWKPISLALAAPLLLGLAASAQADATIDGDVEVSVAKGKKFVVAATVTMSDKGTVDLTGTLGGEALDLTKKFKTKSGKSRTKVIKFAIDPKRYGLRDLSDTLILSVNVSAAETGQAEPDEQSAGGALPPPLMIVPGTSNELTSDGTYAMFRDRLNEEAGNPWLAKGKRATIKIVNYKSLSIGPIPREVFGKEIAKATQRVIKKSLFTRADIVAHSMGGWVVRQAMVPATGKKKAPLTLDGQVRQVFFMGVAQSGTPVTYLADVAIRSAKAAGLKPIDVAGPLLDSIDNPLVGQLAGLLLNEAFSGVVEAFFPTYAFATVPNPIGGGTIDLTLPTLTALPGPSVIPPLSDLNAIDPDPMATYHALNYTDVIGSTGELRTVESVDLSSFLAGGGTDLSTVGLVNGPGDGLAPWTSALMESHPNWNAVLIPVDLGPGLHTGSLDVDGPPAYWNDRQVSGYIRDRVLAGTAP